MERLGCQQDTSSERLAFFRQVVDVHEFLRIAPAPHCSLMQPRRARTNCIFIVRRRGSTIVKATRDPFCAVLDEVCLLHPKVLFDKQDEASVRRTYSHATSCNVFYEMQSPTQTTSHSNSHSRSLIGVPISRRYRRRLPCALAR